jgi:hypothetical protein
VLADKSRDIPLIRFLQSNAISRSITSNLMHTNTTPQHNTLVYYYYYFSTTCFGCSFDHNQTADTST